MGETTYFYNFYKTRFGFVGKLLVDQSIRVMIQGTDHPSGLDTEGALGLDGGKWITKNIVRFPTWKGMKEVHLKPSNSSVDTADIEAFITKAENKVSGQTITINSNRLETHYDELSGQKWIEVTSDYDQGAIPSQQCSRITRNEEQGYYMLEKCTHQWEYPLYPMTESR